MAVSPRPIWDALFLAGGELLMRTPASSRLHSLTSLNALHYAYRTTGDEGTRKFMLLQAAAFVPLFREAMKVREKNIGDLQIDQLERHNPVPSKNAGDIFDELSRHKPSAARRALEYIYGEPDAGQGDLIDAGRRLIFLKGTDSHDYKFSSAVLEDYCVHRARVARPLPGREPLLAEGLRRARLRPGEAHARGNGVALLLLLAQLRQHAEVLQRRRVAGRLPGRRRCRAAAGA